jgi:membrane-bound lytic murein transglycosylase D
MTASTKKILYSSIGVLLLVNFLLLLSTNTKNENSISFQMINSVVKNKVYDFAGEAVPMQDPEVFERLDRELSSNVYWQGNTLQILKLSEKYFPIIEPILKENGIPDDFKYLAVAESGLRHVTSPSGAASTWQIMKTTGKEYGLNINDEIDERYHIEKSTRAACQYLNSAYLKYGNWTLAAASYNMGMAGLQGKINEQLEDNYYNLWLNQETSRYVFRLIAYKEILQNPKSYGFIYQYGVDAYPSLTSELKSVPLPIYDLALWAKDNQTNYKTIRTLNPWIRGNKITSVRDTAIQIAVPSK